MKTFIKTSNNKIHTFDLVCLYTASVFSCIFASSILLEVYKLFTPYIFAVISAFILYFLFINEKTKIAESRKEKITFRLFIPFVVTLATTVIGVYFLTNKSIENNINISNNNSQIILNIEAKYQTKIDSINTLDYYKTNDYTTLTNQIKDFKKFTFDTTQRRINKSMVNNIYNQISQNKAKFDTSKVNQIKSLTNLKNLELNKANVNTSNKFIQSKLNNFISWFCIILSILLETTIFTLNRKLGEKLRNIENLHENNSNIADYNLYRNMLNFIYEIHNVESIISFKMLQHSYFAKKNNLDFENIKEIYDTYISIGLLEKYTDIEAEEQQEEQTEPQEKKTPKYQIKFTKKEALKRFDKCFEYTLQ